MKKKQLITIVFSLVLVGLFLPNSSARAQVQQSFGGIVSFPITCTCPGSAGNRWIWFTPLDLGGPAPYITGPLVYSLYSTILYSNRSPGVPLYQHIGDYTPGVQACWMTIVTGCIPLPNLGLMFQLGTS